MTGVFIVSEMTYNVSSGTLNTTIPYYLCAIHGTGYNCLYWFHQSLWLGFSL